jgi:Tol biopolymer transport system component
MDCARPGACYDVTVRMLSLAALLAGGVFLAAPAVAAAGLQLAYSDDNGNLYLGTVAGNDGTAIFQTDGATQMSALSISPDATSVLALASSDTDQLDLVPVSGAAPSPINGTQGADSGSFSPDGNSVIFSIGRQSSPTLSPGIYSVSLAGGTPKQIVSTPVNSTDSLPQLSPNGATVAFVRDTISSSNVETVGLDVAPVSGGSATQLAVGLSPAISGGERLDFSPDGRTLVYAGDYTDPGIYTIAVAGGVSAQITSDSDYWPSFSADGSTVFFARDAFSANADDNAVSPVAPAAGNDIDELWSVNANGSSPSVIAEGDFETLALAPNTATSVAVGSAGSSGSSSTGSTGTTGTSTGAPVAGGGAAATGPGGGAPTSLGASAVGSTASTSATGIHVVVHGSHYIVTWKGDADEWKVQLRVGRKSVTAKVAGPVHTHTFTLHGAKGAPRAAVKTALV